MERDTPTRWRPMIDRLLTLERRPPDNVAAMNSNHIANLDRDRIVKASGRSIMKRSSANGRWPMAMRGSLGFFRSET